MTETYKDLCFAMASLIKNTVGMPMPNWEAGSTNLLTSLRDKDPIYYDILFKADDRAKIVITRAYLREHPDHIFVFGDNTLRIGRGGAALLRDEPNTFGFITKLRPDNRDGSFYKPEEYFSVFDEEYASLESCVKANPDKLYLISQLGAGLANRFGIWEKVVRPEIIKLRSYPNVMFLFNT